MLDIRAVERRRAIAARMTAFVAVFASALGAVLMMVGGSMETAEAAWALVQHPDTVLTPGDSMALRPVGAMDRFLAAIVPLCFSFGICLLFVLFLRVALEGFIADGPDLPWMEIVKLLTLPAAIVLLSAAPKLAEPPPKPRPPRTPEREE